jgi:hypothetical protein
MSIMPISNTAIIRKVSIGRPQGGAWSASNRRTGSKRGSFGKIPDPAGPVAATGAPYLPPRQCRQLHKALFANLPKVLVAGIHQEPITSRMGGPKPGRHAKGTSEGPVSPTEASFTSQ